MSCPTAPRGSRRRSIRKLKGSQRLGDHQIAASAHSLEQILPCWPSMGPIRHHRRKIPPLGHIYSFAMSACFSALVLVSPSSDEEHPVRHLHSFAWLVWSLLRVMEFVSLLISYTNTHSVDTRDRLHMGASYVGICMQTLQSSEVWMPLFCPRPSWTCKHMSLAASMHPRICSKVDSCQESFEGCRNALHHHAYD